MPERFPDLDPDDATGGRRAWLPIVIVGAVVVLVFLAAMLVFRDADPDPAISWEGTMAPRATALGTVPGASAAPTSATAPTIAPITPTTIVPVPTVFPPSRSAGDGEEDDENEEQAEDAASTTERRRVGADSALQDYALEQVASVTSDIVTIGSTQYAVVVSSGAGELLSWDGDEWTVEERLQTPASIVDVDTTDVTGDGSPDFVVRLAGIDRPGGVFSRATFTFDFLPFNTLAGGRTSSTGSCSTADGWSRPSATPTACGRSRGCGRGGCSRPADRVAVSRP